jgi:pectate lyase
MQIDTEELNIKYIKENYPKDVRVDLIVSLKSLENISINQKKTIQGIEAQKKIEGLHKMLDQIFNVILKNFDWNISASSDSWDYRPINVMKKSFPKIEKTQWYDLRHAQVISKLNKSSKSKIDVQDNTRAK